MCLVCEWHAPIDLVYTYTVYIQCMCAFKHCTMYLFPCKSCVPLPWKCVPTLLSQQTILCTCYVCFFPFQTQFPPHEPKVETGKDLQLQTMKARVDRYRQERDKARSEVKTLQKQLEQSVGEAERGSSFTTQYEKRIQQLETVVADTNRKHEEHMEKLTKEFENILSQKEMEYRARMRNFGEDPSSSAQQLEAFYQNQLQLKEKELCDKENDFARKQKHYLTQISQLETACNVATRKEGEARKEVERMKMEHHSQFHRLQVPHAQTGVSKLNKKLFRVCPCVHVHHCTSRVHKNRRLE